MTVDLPLALLELVELDIDAGVPYERTSKLRKNGCYSCQKGGTYDSDAQLLSSSDSRAKVGTSACFFDAGCNAGDEGVAFAEAGGVGCCTAAEVSGSDTCTLTSWFTKGRFNKTKASLTRENDVLGMFWRLKRECTKSDA